MIKSIRINNYRNLNAKFEFTPNTNVIIAQNGKGKSNLLEAIYLSVNGFDLSTLGESDNISWDYSDSSSKIPYYSISSLLKFEDQEEERLVYYQDNFGFRRQFKINGKSKKASAFTNKVSAVIFAPESIDLITSTPSVRRKEIDNFIQQVDNSTISMFDEYAKALRMRNKLLDFDFTSVKKQIDFWNEKLIELGTVITNLRIETIKLLEVRSSLNAKNIYHFNENIFGFKYFNKYFKDITKLSSEEIASHLRDKLYNNIEKEVAVGSTLYGPHRDDIDVYLNQRSLRSFGSRGQQRLASFIIKTSEYEMLKEKGKDLILLIDDLPSELDNKHVKNSEKYLSSLDSQIIASAVESSEYTKDFLSKANILTL